MTTTRRGPGRGGASSVRFLALALLLLAGCAPARTFPASPAPETLPPGSPLRSRSLDPGTAWLRYYLITGDDSAALAAFGRHSAVAPGDHLLRALQHALVLRRAGEYARSNRSFEWAEAEIERRYTRSVSRGVGSILVSDRTLAYVPTTGERMMIPYYRMLNYLALGDTGGALVEARKANELQARLDPGPVEDCRESGMVQYLAGLVERAAGERNDALVSLRQAERAFDGCPGGEAPPSLGGDLYRAARSAGVEELADSVQRRYALAPDSAAGWEGDLVLLVESGFVGFRAEEALHVPILSDDVRGLGYDDELGIERAAERVSYRMRRRAWERGGWDADGSAGETMAVAAMLEGDYVLRVAWPAFRLEADAPAGVRVLVADSAAPLAGVGDLSLVVRDEMERQRPAMLTRLVARGLTKYILANQVEKKARKQGGDGAGYFFGLLANLAANETEHADTRSWSLLPDRVMMTRLRLPAGSYHVRVEVTGEAGAVHVHDLGQVHVEPGSLAVLSDRVWGGEGRDLPVTPMEEPPPPADSVGAATASAAE